MTPTWYDLLGVDPDAPEAEIRGAWKGAIAELDPGDRRFRTLNQAAEVLLDPVRRAAYDAELAAQQPVDELVGEPWEETAEETVAKPVPTSGPRRRVVPAWMLLGVGVLTAALVVAAALLARQPSDDAVADAARAAQAAAERAVPPVLSYDAADLEGSRSAAAAYLTASYQKERDQLFEEVIDANAPNTGTRLATSVVDSSIVRATDDDRVQVFLFIDQAATNKEQTEPQVTRTWVTMTMERVEDEWLVAAMRVV
ncbi:DnaJ domain-containing protein [Nocardioides sp. W7]|uniref:J domain-containing protein n=1 Tax=Nocardioides sp. W7 TaxID=2931390 RepID=UPI001FD24FB3|nr:DnaJ domain-containing protein [Nocardioides sp. W7]